MAAHEGPVCFFSFGSGLSGGGPPSRQAGAPPSGIVCTPTLGGGSGGGPAGRFVLLPKAGFSFAAWLRLEDDGREAAEQLLAPETLIPQQAEHAGAAAAAATAAAVASDQAVFALLHQQQPSGSHAFMLHHQQQGQLLQGVALAVRRPPPGAGAGAAGSPRSPRAALQLVAHSWSPKHAEAVLPLQHSLMPGRWHHVVLAHSAGGALSHPQLSLYLDGELQVQIFLA